MIVRLFSGPDGLSHFEDINPDFNVASRGGAFRTEVRPNEVVFYESFPPDFTDPIHVGSRRRQIVTLQGHFEVGNGAGETRVFGPGDIMLVEDFTGKGHQTRVVGGERRYSMVINI